jgi:hypothetical protein
MEGVFLNFNHPFAKVAFHISKITSKLSKALYILRLVKNFIM